MSNSSTNGVRKIIELSQFIEGNDKTATIEIFDGKKEVLLYNSASLSQSEKDALYKYIKRQGYETYSFRNIHFHPVPRPD